MGLFSKLFGTRAKPPALKKLIDSLPLKLPIGPSVQPGTHSFSLPYDWARFEETLVLANYTPDTNYFDKMARAIFAFDWRKRQVEVLPQDWFNSGNYDFGYQWISRVARQADGSIVGDGVRLGAFELDSTNRQVKKWLIQDPFY